MTTEPGLPRASLYVLGLAWVIPFLQPYHRFPITAFYSEWLALALGLAAALPLVRAESWRAAGFPAVALFPLGLILLLGVHVALGRVTYPEQALVAALYLMWAVLLVALGRLLRSELGLAAVADVLAWFVLIGALLNAVAALLQLYDAAGPLASLVADSHRGEIYGNLQQRNQFATYGAMGVASVAYLYARGRVARRHAALCVLLLMLVLAVSGARGPWLYLIVFTALAAILHRLRRDAASRRLAVCSLWLWLAFALAQWAAMLPLLRPDPGPLTSAERLFYLAGGLEARLQFARAAWQMFLDAPWIGVGWGEYAWRHFLYLGSPDGDMLPCVANHAHNIVLQLMAETGIVGAGLLAVGAALWLADLRSARFDLEWWWLLALAAALGIYSMIEFPLWYAYFLGVAAVLAGLGSERTLSVRSTGAARIIVALSVVSGAIHLAAALGPYREFERLVFDPKRQAALVMTDETFGEAITRLRREPVLAPYVELALTLGMDVTPDHLPEKLEVSARAMHFAPANLVVLRQAMLLALAGDGAAAARRFEQAARAYPLALDDAMRELGEAARRHPAEFTPLLELTAARRAELRGRTLEDDARRH